MTFSHGHIVRHCESPHAHKCRPLEVFLSIMLHKKITKVYDTVEWYLQRHNIYFTLIEDILIEMI